MIPVLCISDAVCKTGILTLNFAKLFKSIFLDYSDSVIEETVVDVTGTRRTIGIRGNFYCSMYKYLSEMQRASLGFRIYLSYLQERLDYTTSTIRSAITSADFSNLIVRESPFGLVLSLSAILEVKEDVMVNTAYVTLTGYDKDCSRFEAVVDVVQFEDIELKKDERYQAVYSVLLI